MQWLLGIEAKSDPNTTVTNLPTRSPEDIRRDILTGEGLGGYSAVQTAAVFACARVIAEGLAQVPCLLQRRSATGGYEPATDHPLYDLLTRAPNTFQTSFEFREQLGFTTALSGNAYVYVSRDPNGRAIELIPIANSSVSLDTSVFGEVNYTIAGVGGGYTNRNVWHLRGPSLDGFRGVSIQQLGARAIGLASDMEAFGAQLFQNGARPSGILTTDQSLTVEQHSTLIAAWNAQQAGIGNAHKTALLANGLEFQTIQTSANDAQFIEARRYQTEEICRLMRVDPIMVMQAVGGAAYASIEQRFLAHHQHTLGPWYSRFEQSAEVSLLSKAEQATHRIHLDSRSMMRGNAIDRATYLASMKQNGFMTTNECREFEGFDRSTDPAADQLSAAANLYGDAGQSQKPIA